MELDNVEKQQKAIARLRAEHEQQETWRVDELGLQPLRGHAYDHRMDTKHHVDEQN